MPSWIGQLDKLLQSGQDKRVVAIESRLGTFGRRGRFQVWFEFSDIYQWQIDLNVKSTMYLASFVEERFL